MKKMMIIILIVVFILIVCFVFMMGSYGQDPKKFAYLREPQISNLPNQKMIEIRLTGDPNQTAGKGIGQLFSMFFRLKDNKLKQVAPRGRWPMPLDTKKDEWLGIYGMPVSENIQSLPEQKSGDQVVLTVWEYGTVAEILHEGPYSTEVPTVEKLKKFIADNGYEIIGEHEEEYLKGPGLWPVDPKDYLTIIRYRIKKK